MKRNITILAAFLLVSILAQSQVLVKWTFPTGNPSDSIADGGVPANLEMAIRTEGGTSGIDFSKNGFSTKSAQATNWDDGAMVKCWVIQFDAQGYENLKLSSKMQSGGNNPGPKDFEVQYRLGITGDWTDVPGSVLIVANDWTTGVLDSIALPAACDNKPSVFIRWITTSNTNSIGETLTSSGINKIDDIYITGHVVSTGMNDLPQHEQLKVFPNPCNGNLTIEASKNITSVMLSDAGGKSVTDQTGLSSKRLALDLEEMPNGIYFLKVRMADGTVRNEKLVLM